MDEINSNKKVLRGENFLLENRSNRINRIDDRCNNTFHASRELVSAYREYARRSGKSLVECFERALISDMESNPVETVRLDVQQIILSELPSRRDSIQIADITNQLTFIIGRMKDLDGNNCSDLKKRLIKLLMRGAKIKTTTEEFIGLMEEAMKYV